MPDTTTVAAEGITLHCGHTPDNTHRSDVCVPAVPHSAASLAALIRQTEQQTGRTVTHVTVSHLLPPLRAAIRNGDITTPVSAPAVTIVAGDRHAATWRNDRRIDVQVGDYQHVA
jgi:hypothetical protein